MGLLQFSESVPEQGILRGVALWVKVGDKIIFSKYAGTEVKFEGTKYLIVSERDILAII